MALEGEERFERVRTEILGRLIGVHVAKLHQRLLRFQNVRIFIPLFIRSAAQQTGIVRRIGLIRRRGGGNVDALSGSGGGIVQRLRQGGIGIVGVGNDDGIDTVALLIGNEHVGVDVLGFRTRKRNDAPDRTDERGKHDTAHTAQHAETDGTGIGKQRYQGGIATF